jgi:hypothetical protein
VIVSISVAEMSDCTIFKHINRVKRAKSKVKLLRKRISLDKNPIAYANKLIKIVDKYILKGVDNGEEKGV